MRHANSKKIFQYWNNLRGNRSAPDRREIEPSDIRDLLGDTFILEVNPVYKTISFRLAGTRLCSAYGRELKGLGFLALWDEKDNLEIISAIRSVQSDSKPCAIVCLAQSEGKRFMEYEMLLLPLKNGESETMRILGTATPLKKEPWTGSDALQSNRLKHLRYLDLESSGKAPSLTTPMPSMDTKDSDGVRKVAHLTVIEGGMGD